MNPGETISIKPEHIFEIGNFDITNSLFLSLLVVLMFLLFGFFFRKRISVIPNKSQLFLEILIEKALELMENVLGNRALAQKYLPYIASIFLFILTSNWLGLLPGLTAVGLKERGIIVPFLRSPASDLNFTLALALVAVIVTHAIAIRSIGLRLHVSKFVNFQNPIKFFVGILELISEAAKIVSFSFRLFGNIFAGEVLLIVIGFLVPFFMPVPFLLMEFFVGFIQAFIFAMLALVFLAAAIEPHGQSH